MAASRFCLLLLSSLAFSPTSSLETNLQTNVNIEAIPLLTEVEQGQPVQQSVMFRLLSPDIEDASQDGLVHDQDLTIVLDVSGSMRSSGKLEKAKAAIAGIVNSLRPRDRLNLITYHSTARVEFTGGMAEHKEELLAQVAELTPQSSTNLHAGLKAAEGLLAPESDLGSSVRRIFLFSDGLVNSGVTDRGVILRKVEGLRQQGSTTSAFGIGADYDHELMSSIAEAGHGEFFFIQGQEDMEKVVRVATTGFRNLFATEARLRLTALNEATGLHAYGKGYHHDDSAKAVDISLGDLRGGDARTILVDVKLPGLRETTEYLAYELEYLATGASVSSKQTGRMTVHPVANGSQTTKPNNAVLLFRKLQHLLAREEDIEEHIESGDIDSASFYEDELEKNLKDMAYLACVAPETSEEVHTCSRTTSAWSRTMKSQKMFKAGVINSHDGMASNLYKFKRQMNAELSESKDEL